MVVYSVHKLPHRTCMYLVFSHPTPTGGVESRSQLLPSIRQGRSTLGHTLNCRHSLISGCAAQVTWQSPSKKDIPVHHEPPMESIQNHGSPWYSISIIFKLEGGTLLFVSFCHIGFSTTNNLRIDAMVPQAKNKRLGYSALQNTQEEIWEIIWII